jgi:hypothetical protein
MARVRFRINTSTTGLAQPTHAGEIRCLGQGQVAEVTLMIPYRHWDLIPSDASDDPLDGKRVKTEGHYEGLHLLPGDLGRLLHDGP